MTVRHGILIITALIVIPAVFFALQRTSAVPQPVVSQTTPIPEPSGRDIPSTTSLCPLSSLTATLATEPAAGNVYGTFTLKNSGTETCKIPNNLIAVQYDTKQVTNIRITHSSLSEVPEFSLQPGKAIYASLHYPNGPQCSGSTEQLPVTYIYSLTPELQVIFTDGKNNRQFQIPVCQSVEVSTVAISGMKTNLDSLPNAGQ
jgi:hypothetical protein